MKKIDLSGDWTLQPKNGEWSVPATVPGDNVSALLAAGKIPDPYWADNELQLQWIGREGDSPPTYKTRAAAQTRGARSSRP
jgi:beta-mannosidase